MGSIVKQREITPMGVEDENGSSSSSDVPYATLEPSQDEEEEGEGAISGARKRRKPSAMVACNSLSWIPQALASMQAAGLLINNRAELRAHPHPHSCLPDLHVVRAAATALVHDSDDAILFAQTRFESTEKILREQLLGLQGELVRQQELLQEAMAQSAHYSKLLTHARRKSNKMAALLQQARAESNKKTALLHSARMEVSKQAALLDCACADCEKQSTFFEKEKGSLTLSHKLRRETLIQQQKALQRESEGERKEYICIDCNEQRCDTIIQPCLHFHYCFTCLLRHRKINSNTCPTCRGPIQGLSVSSDLASQ